MLKKTSFLFVAVALSLLALLSSCQSRPEEEVMAVVEKTAKEIFDSKDKVEINQELEYFSLYLPKKMQVEEATENNLILTDGKQSYFIFYNNLEAPTSELNFDHIEQEDKDILLIQSFKDSHKFGYVQVRSDEEDEYELQIGIGGVKITTYTEKSKVINHTEEIMKVARSIVETGEN